MHYGGHKLDPFQADACKAIDDGHSVIVAAPTGAGKTVIAEYATEVCRKRNRRIVYTAPIKALSNQKYRDFRALYGEDVGIVTGDVVINSTAPIVVMTTEILRNTIFEDISQLHDIEYVVFDEIHYINDIERGTVWEESIIFAPQNIKLICLSATMPNLRQFSDWIASVREVPIQVIEEHDRPVPLERMVYMPGRDIGTVDDLERTANNLQERLKDIEDEGGRRRRRRFRPDNYDPTELIEHLADEDRLPALYFCFSRRGCEERARLFRHYGSLLSPNNSADILNDYDELCRTFDITDDARAMEFRELVEGGIAYHHAGMLPTLKEVVERLFTLGKIQLLLTTETFAVGINMPARTVVFEGLEKYDGVSVRHLKAREYQQMSGRAGRRGIDEQGYVYATVDPEFARMPEIRHVLTGEPEAIESQFNLSYSSILNLLDEYGEMMFEVCRKSFSNHQSTYRVRELETKREEAEQAGEALPSPKCIHGYDAMEALTQHQNMSLVIEERIGELRPARSRVKRKYSGRRKKRDRIRRLAQLDRQEADIKTQIREARCHGCSNLNECQMRYAALNKAAKSVTTLGEEIERVKHYHEAQIRARMALMERLGYIEGLRVQPRGRVAQQIYGYELAVTELMLAGYFERLDPDSINVLAVSMVFEAKRDGWFARVDDTRITRMLKSAEGQVERARALELECGVDTLSQPIEGKLAAATLAWSRGCEFDELQNYTSTPEGDIVRVFRAAADLLRQMRRSLSDHPTLPELLLDAIKLLNRDVVDAEQQLRKVLPGAEPRDVASTADDASAHDDSPGESDGPRDEEDAPEPSTVLPSTDAAAS
ncbi:hypothetical protein CMK11_21330 [Candidatus Poribacteria bacterium]|nr:hypothetical protein [Candidatus Poribacteria bacterium]